MSTKVVVVDVRGHDDPLWMERMTERLRAAGGGAEVLLLSGGRDAMAVLQNHRVEILQAPLYLPPALPGFWADDPHPEVVLDRRETSRALAWRKQHRIQPPAHLLSLTRNQRKRDRRRQP